MAKFVELKEAADKLGITQEELIELRERGEIHGYRDGTSWKFKAEEVDRVHAERASGGGKDDDMSPLAFDDNDLNLSPDEENSDNTSGESILVSEEALGHSGESTSSTIIGKMSTPVVEEDSDLKLTNPPTSSLSLLPELETGSDMPMTASGSLGSDLTLQPGIGADTDVTLVPGVSEDSDVTLIPTAGTDLDMGPVGGKHDVLAGTDLELTTASSGGTGPLASTPSDVSLGTSDLDMHLDSGLAIADDDDLVLGGGTSDSGLEAGDSGINLTSPTDSGLSLEEEPLDLAGSSKISSLELPEDEDGLMLEETEPAGGAKPDEEFLLSPSGPDVADDTDSGSQVIALEESTGAFDLEGGLGVAPVVVEEAPGLGVPLDAGMAVSPQPIPAGAYQSAELPYSIWNVLGLGTIFIVLSVGGMLMVDVVRNMWSWNGNTSAVSSVAEGIAGLIGF